MTNAQIRAYRVTRGDYVDSGEGLQEDWLRTDYDDDGESAAGARLAHLLALMKAADVVLVVSRWYGGVQLGADRFRHINAAGRDAMLRLAARPGPAWLSKTDGRRDPDSGGAEEIDGPVWRRIRTVE